MDIHSELLPAFFPMWDVAWREMNHHLPFQSPSWMQTWVTTYAPTTPLCIITEEPDHIVAPFRIQNHQASLMGMPDLSDSEDIIGSYPHVLDAWPHILEVLVSQSVTSLTLTNVWQDSPTLAYFQDKPQATITQTETTPCMELPTTWETYVESLPKKERHELERKLRKFEREHPTAGIETTPNIVLPVSPVIPAKAGIQSTTTSSPQFTICDAQSALNELITLMKLDPRKAAFFTPEVESFFRQIPEIAADSTQLMMLSVDGQSVASVIGFISDDTYYLYNSGFDEGNYKGAGFYLKAMNIKWAIEHGIKNYNFLRGNERYKYELGGKDFGVYRIDVTL